jgi:hypothetical protein
MSSNEDVAQKEQEGQNNNEQQKSESKILKAAVFGASGAVGKNLVRELIYSPRWAHVNAYVRKEIIFPNVDSSAADPKKDPTQHAKLTQIKIDFEKDLMNNAKDWKKEFEGIDVVFCTLGASPDDKDQFHRVDHDYIVGIAERAKEAGVPHFCLLSSVKAKSKSDNLYEQVKGRVRTFLFILLFVLFFRCHFLTFLVVAVGCRLKRKFVRRAFLASRPSARRFSSLSANKAVPCRNFFRPCRPQSRGLWRGK